MANNWGYNPYTEQESCLGCLLLYIVPFIIDFLIVKFVLPQEFKEVVAVAMFIPFINLVTLTILCIAGLIWLLYSIYEFALV